MRRGALRVMFAEYAAAGHAYSDMVVLLQSISRVNDYAAALRAEGLPCVVAGGSIFNRAPEVALMVRLAQAVANPKWTSALFEVLSSELFALSADHLLEMSTGFDDERGIPRGGVRPGVPQRQRKVARGARRARRRWWRARTDASGIRAGG